MVPLHLQSRWSNRADFCFHDTFASLNVTLLPLFIRTLMMTSEPPRWSTIISPSQDPWHNISKVPFAMQGNLLTSSGNWDKDICGWGGIILLTTSGKLSSLSFCHLSVSHFPYTAPRWEGTVVLFPWWSFVLQLSLSWRPGLSVGAAEGSDRCLVSGRYVWWTPGHHDTGGPQGSGLSFFSCGSGTFGHKNGETC